MDEMNQKLAIPVKGLPMGGSSFSFVIDGKFFQEFGNAQIKDADCSVKVSVMRHQTLLDVGCIIGGYVVVECDRCLEDLVLPVETSFEQTYTPDSDELDLSQDVYDFVMTSLPMQKVHAEGECNEETTKYLSK